MTIKRPSVFIASSTEGLDYAKAIQLNLDHSCEIALWSQGVFGLSNGTLEDLVKKLESTDFGIIVVTPDDLIESRGQQSASPRDNVLLELGMCIGALGQKRSFIVYDRTKSIKLPSDIAGITLATYQIHSDNNIQASFGAPSTLIEQKIQELGLRPKIGQTGLINENEQFRTIADLLGPVASNIIIHMHEVQGELERETNNNFSLPTCWYAINSPKKHKGSGRFKINDLCEKVVDADLLQQDLKNNISLTKRGGSFAQWLTSNDYKAESFLSPLGEWGDISGYDRESVELFKQGK